MPKRTIHCDLVASEETRKYLWHLMADIYTPFINEMLVGVAQHPDFEEWCEKGKIPANIFEDFRKNLREEPAFKGIPARWYYAGCDLVKRIYKSWLAIRRRLQNQLADQSRWLAILQSDDLLAEISGLDIESIQAEAEVILTKLSANKLKANKCKKNSKSTEVKEEEKKPNFYHDLFKLYETAKTDSEKCVVTYLLKNRCQIPKKAEDPKKLQKRRRKAKIRIERLSDRLTQTRLPKGRDLTDRAWLEALELMSNQVPASEDEAAAWQAYLLTEASKLPFPISYETNEDLIWSVNNKGRLCVSFNGLTELVFEIYCGDRYLHLFKRFFEDQELKEANEDTYSAAVLTLRTGRIKWKEERKQGEPWNANRLALHCSIETLLWTREGTEQIQQEKSAQIVRVISGMKKKDNLTAQQESFIRKREKTLSLLKNPLPRPSKRPYQGDASILAAVSFGLHKPATLAIVNVTTGSAITYRSIRQLLGSNYRLLNRHRQHQQKQSHKRHNNQCKGATSHVSEGKLGDYIDSLIGKAIIQIAWEFNASSIVLPNLGDIREIVQSEVQARAEEKIPELKEAQKKYAQEYRISVHRWSYRRLAQKITSKALQTGMTVESAKQPLQGSPQEKARELAVLAYQSRKVE